VSGTENAKERIELAQNARDAPCRRGKRPTADSVRGCGKVSAARRKAAPAISSNKDYPDSGDKRVADLETALRECGLRDGMVISNHHHLRDATKWR